MLRRIVEDHGAAVVDHVVTARDKATMDDGYEAIVRLARSAGIPVVDRGQPLPEGTQARFLFAVGWRWLIGLRPGQELVVFHDALLPRYRGFAPLVSALVNGEPQVGVTALFGSAEYDRGPIIAQRALPLHYPVTIAQVFRDIAPLYAELASQLVSLAMGGDLRGEHQDESRASYSLWRDDADYLVDLRWDAARIRRFVDAVGPPYKGALVHLEGVPCRIRACVELPDVVIENRTPGKVIFMQGGKPVVVCGTGTLRIDALNDEQGRDLLPLPRFRMRFAGRTD